jgi:hypothetical protein
MSPLFTSRAAIYVVGGGAGCTASWPLGKIELDSTSLRLCTPFRDFCFTLVHIDCVRVRLLGAVIEHHEPGVPSLVSVGGIFLFRRLRAAVQKFEIPLVLKP